MWIFQQVRKRLFYQGTRRAGWLHWATATVRQLVRHFGCGISVQFELHRIEQGCPREPYLARFTNKLQTKMSHKVCKYIEILPISFNLLTNFFSLKSLPVWLAPIPQALCTFLIPNTWFKYSGSLSGLCKSCEWSNRLNQVYCRRGNIYNMLEMGLSRTGLGHPCHKQTRFFLTYKKFLCCSLNVF